MVLFRKNLQHYWKLAGILNKSLIILRHFMNCTLSLIAKKSDISNISKTLNNFNKTQSMNDIFKYLPIL